MEISMAQTENSETLADYLAEVVRCERSLFSLRQIKEGYTNQLNTLEEPAKPIEPSPNYVHETGVLWWVWFVWFGLAGIGICITMLVVPGLYAEQRLLSLIGLVLISIPLICRGITKSGKAAKYRREYPRYMKEYESNLSEYNKKLAKYNDKKQTMKQEISEINTCGRETEGVLAKLYDVGVIFPKYRNLIAVSMFLEYIQSGRCETLDGRDGTYNLYENELLLNRIIGRLDVALTKLDQIRDAQYLVFQAVNESNRIAAASLGELQSAGRSATAAALYAKETARNSQTLVDLNRDKYGRLVTKGGRVL